MKKLTKQRLLELKSWIEEDLKFSSNLSLIHKHPAHQEIVSYGWSAIPFILKDLQKEPSWWWFPALVNITGDNPVKYESRGLLYEVTKDWLEWSHRNGIIIDLQRD